MADTQSSDARWEAAAVLARNVAVPKRRSRRWWTWAWIVLVVIGAGVLAFSLTSWILPTGEGGHLELVPSRLAVQSTLTALVGLVLLYGVFRASITERIVEWSTTIMSALSRSEKRSVRRQLAGKESADENRLPVILAIARQNQRITEGSVPLFVTYGLLYVIIEIREADSTDPYGRLFSIALALPFVACAAYLAVTYVRTARCIRINSEQSPSAHD